MLDDDSWDDDEWNAEGAEGLEFDDDFGMPALPPSYEAFKPPKADVFLSVLDLYRDRERDKFVKNLPRLNFAPVIPDECKRDEDDQQLPGISEAENAEKLRQSITQTYKDFLKYKRSSLTNERLKEFRGMGEDRGFHSFGGVSAEVEPTERKAQSFAYGGDIDKTLDMSSLIKDKSLYEEEEECKIDPEKDEQEAKTDYLIEDQYYPGLIDDAVNKKVDFYHVAFDLTFGSDTEPPEDEPEKTPISLVEAFDLRVSKEQGARKKIMKQAAPGASSMAQKELTDMGKSFVSFLKDYESPTRLINRDEVVLANTVDVELATLIRNKPVNELTQAINCLQKAEIMNEYDKSLQAAEEAYSKAPPELAESAAVQKATTFRTDELSKKSATVGGGKSYKPIEIVSYMGITKPIAGTELDETRAELEESNLRPTMDESRKQIATPKSARAIAKAGLRHPVSASRPSVPRGPGSVRTPARTPVQSVSRLSSNRMASMGAQECRVPPPTGRKPSQLKPPSRVRPSIAGAPPMNVQQVKQPASKLRLKQYQAR